MADDVCFIFFRSGRGDLDTAAVALAARGMSVTRSQDEYGEELTVAFRDGPELRIAFSHEPHVRVEAEEIAEGDPDGGGLAACDARYEVLIDDLDAVLDESNTLIEVQLTLQGITNGHTLRTWNGMRSDPPYDDA